MFHSSVRLFLALGFSSFLGLSCTKADKSPDGVNGPHGTSDATFLISSAKGSAFAGMVKKSNSYTAHDGSQRISKWKFPLEANYTFSVCIQDKAARSRASGHRFNVEIPGKRGLRVDDVRPTDPDGCMSWIETIPYSAIVKQSRWVEIERDIVGAGVHTGRQRLRFAVNPWLIRGERGEGDEVYYLRQAVLPNDKIVPAAQADQAFSGELLGKADLRVEEVHVQNLRRQEGNEGTLFQMNVSVEPELILEDAAGLKHYQKIDEGEFDVIAHLVLSQTGPAMKDHMILTSNGASTVLDHASGQLETRTSGRVINGKLVAYINVWSNIKLPQGNMQLVLKLLPKGVRGINDFEGIFELGNQKSLSSNSSGPLSKECREERAEGVKQNCDVSTYLRSAANFNEVYKKQLSDSEELALNTKCKSLTSEQLKTAIECKDREKDITKNSPYLFDRMNLRFVQVDDYETTMQRWVDYTVSTCVTDAFTGERVVGMKFKIKYHPSPDDPPGAPEELTASTLEDGCLNWSSKIFHKYYQPEQFIKKTVTIEKGTGFKRDMTFYINPWDDKFTFGFDERQFSSEFWGKQERRNKIRSRFFLADFGYHTVRFQYNIDSLMNLEVRKTVLMELEPRVLRYSGIVNARKMTEPLRDGIWLMKVGLQKNYLDPAQIGVSIEALKDNQGGAEGQAVVKLSSESAESRERTSLNRLRKLGISAPSREFISTQTALVRSTDGVIIQPVELKMQDLRMMRVRSNFLVQLQAVDEAKLQVHNGLDRNFRRSIDLLMEKRRTEEEKRQMERKGNEDDTAEKARRANEEKEIRDKVEARKGVVKRIFDYIMGLPLKESVSSVHTSLVPFELTPEDRQYISSIIDGDLTGLNLPQIEGKLRQKGQDFGLKHIDTELKPNDFTNIKLPSCQEIDCNVFAAAESKDGPDRDMGLDHRTFVGPVIFLSNGYKDSVRATDNLDEAMCGQKVQIDDPFEAELRAKEKELFANKDQHFTKERQNTIYRFSEYFGSLRHLCFAQVDTLIDKEKINRILYEQNAPAMASVYNFVNSFNMNFLSLTDEKPKSVDMSPETLKRCHGDLVSCMRETEEFRFPLSEALSGIERNIYWASPSLITRIFGGERVKDSSWTANDIREALFPPEGGQLTELNQSAQKFAACTLMANSVARDLKVKDKDFDIQNFETRMVDYCMNAVHNPLILDRKLRIFETGQEGDSYVFLGGFQVNLNVGQSFSVSRSESTSGSWGIEAADFVGAGFGARDMRAPGWASLFKPLSLKIGQSSSLGSSNGTSVSDSTYLVAQIAKFRVRLDKFERCVAIHYSPEFEHYVSLRSILAKHDPVRDSVTGQAPPPRGVFVCEGQLNRKPRYIDEKYFYFTQHFTEGDMLDQADLYNHPWLLALRGQRDFSTFVALMRRQENTGMMNYVKSLAWEQKRPDEWPLDQMRNAYKEITPTFPGFYTELGELERGPDFPLQERLRKTDDDINHEVINNPKMLNQRRQEFRESD